MVVVRVRMFNPVGIEERLLGNSPQSYAPDVSWDSDICSWRSSKNRFALYVRNSVAEPQKYSSNKVPERRPRQTSCCRNGSANPQFLRP